MTQEKKTPDADFVARLEALKERNAWSWDQVGQKMQLSRTMLHFLRTGQHKVTAKNLKKLDNLERENEQSLKAVRSETLADNNLVGALASAALQAKIKVSASDIDRGYMRIPLHYRRGSAPPNCKPSVTVKTPASADASKALEAIQRTHQFTPLISICVDELKEACIDKLTPFSYQALVETALTMTFGIEWQKVIDG